MSIIIPVYNKELKIQKTLESVLNQTYEEIEILIINDGSTDCSLNIINQFSLRDKRIKVFSIENSGVSFSRNLGILKSKGSYLTFLDADDKYLPTYIEEMLREITKKNSDVCYSGYSILTEGNQMVNQSYRFKKGEILIDYIMSNIKISTNDWLIKSDLIKNNDIKFPEGEDWGEDFTFFCKILALTNRITTVEKCLTVYNKNDIENNLSKFKLSQIDKDYKILKNIKNDRDINVSKKVEKALINYRLSAQITYKLLYAIKIPEEKKTIVKYYDRYRKDIFKFTLIGGIRNIKLFLNKIKLLMIIFYYKVKINFE